MSILSMSRSNLLLIIFSVLGLSVSGILIHHHVDPASKSGLVQAVCDIGGQPGCDLVNQSNASTLFGMPIAFWGFLFYGLVSVLAVFYARYQEITLLRLIFWLGFIGGLVDFSLFLYSLVIVEAVCNLCVITYICTGVILIIAIRNLKKIQKKGISLFNLDFNLSTMKAQPLIMSTLIFSSIGVVFLASFVYLYAKGSTDSSLNSGGHDVLLEKAWKSYERKYESTPTREIPIEHSPYKGASDPILTIIEFADFLCPHCKLAGGQLKKIVEKYPKSVKVVYKNYPLDQACNQNIKRKFHDGSCKLSYLALCVARQRVPSFWRVHDDIFGNLEKWAKQGGAQNEGFTRIVRNSGVNVQLVSSCINSEKTKPDVVRDIELADSLGVTGTPVLFINGKRVQSLPNDFFFEKLLAYEVQKQVGQQEK